MCVCVCVCVCVWCARARVCVVCVCVRVCVMLCKTKNLLSLERVAGGHQKATESEIRTHIGNTLKIQLFQEGGLMKKNTVRVNAVERNLKLCERSQRYVL